MEKDRKKSFKSFPENGRCIPLAIVIMTIANGMHPTFSERHTQLFIIYDHYRVLTELAEVHTDITRNTYFYVHKIPVTLNGHIAQTCQG